jgi:hypothetical protein
LLGSAAAKKCINATVPVELSVQQPRFDIAVPQTNLEVTDFILNMTQQGRSFSSVVQTGKGTITGSYNISAQFCSPSKGSSKNPTVQVLTHGVGFDKT